MADRDMKKLAGQFLAAIERLHNQSQNIASDPIGGFVKNANIGLRSAELQRIKHHHAVAACADKEKFLSRHWFLNLRL